MRPNLFFPSKNHHAVPKCMWHSGLIISYSLPTIFSFTPLLVQIRQSPASEHWQLSTAITSKINIYLRSAGLMISIVNIWFPTRNWPAAVQWPRLPTINMPGAAAVLVTLLAAAGPHLYISISLVQLQPSCRASLHSAHTTIQPAATFYLDAVKYHICYIGSRLICE